MTRITNGSIRGRRSRVRSVTPYAMTTVILTVMTLRLHADSTMSADNENPKYSRFDGMWTVRAGRFTATGSPSEAVVVTLVATAPFVRLRGTWTSNSSSGTFDLAKR